MDNYTIHLTKKLTDFYKDKNLKIMTIFFSDCLPKLYLETINKYFNYINKYLTKELNQD